MFPPELPVTAANMNYCVVAFGIVFVISIVQWIVDGRKNYVGPHIDAEVLEKGIVEGMPGAGVESEYSGDNKAVSEGLAK